MNDFIDGASRFAVTNPAAIVTPKLVRKWIGILDEHRVDMVKRRSVILQSGPNKVYLFWNHVGDGIPFHAALYANMNDHEPLNTAAINNVRCKMASGDSASLTWNIFSCD